MVVVKVCLYRTRPRPQLGGVHKGMTAFTKALAAFTREGRGWLKTSYGRRGLTENVRIPSYGGGSLKLLKYCHMIFERSLIAFFNKFNSV